MFGGIGTIIGTMIGVWIPGVLRNGIIILGVEPYWQGVIIGLVLVATVWFDQYKRRAAAGGRPCTSAAADEPRSAPTQPSNQTTNPRGNT